MLNPESPQTPGNKPVDDVLYRTWDGQGLTHMQTERGYSFYEPKTKTDHLIRCHECGMENWQPSVASGDCAWCGWKVETLHRWIR